MAEDTQKKEISIVLAGDVMLGRQMNEVLHHQGPAYPFGNTRPILEQADLTIINLECVIARDGKPWSRWPKVFHFRADPLVALPALQLAGIDCVTLANNHVLDYEEEGLLEMLHLLDEQGLAHAGAGRNRQEAQQPALLETQGLDLAVVAITDNEPGWVATAAHPGTNYLPISLDNNSLREVSQSIDMAREAGSEFVIVSAHWGPNMRQRPFSYFRKFARAVIEAGADSFFGHSAHLFQGIEIYQNRPIIYDAGDFVDDYSVDPRLHNDWGLLFRLHLSEHRVRQLELIPVFISNCQVNLASGITRTLIVERICALCAEIGTVVQHQADHLFIDCNKY